MILKFVETENSGHRTGSVLKIICEDGHSVINYVIQLYQHENNANPNRNSYKCKFDRRFDARVERVRLSSVLRKVLISLNL